MGCAYFGSLVIAHWTGTGATGGGGGGVGAVGRADIAAVKVAIAAVTWAPSAARFAWTGAGTAAI